MAVLRGTWCKGKLINGGAVESCSMTNDEVPKPERRMIQKSVHVGFGAKVFRLRQGYGGQVDRSRPTTRSL